MTDFDYEVKQKKQVARSAKYKVSGKCSKKCSLPTDYMTQKELNKMNGPTISYNRNKPMLLDEFLKLPPVSGQNYIQGLVDTYACNYTTLADMFHCARSTCRRILSADPYSIKFKPGSAMTKEKRELWNKFLGVTEPGEAKTEPEQEQVEEEKPEPKKAAPTTMKMDEFVLRFSGNLTAEAIANSLRLILGDGAEGTIVIKGSFCESLNG